MADARTVRPIAVPTRFRREARRRSLPVHHLEAFELLRLPAPEVCPSTRFYRDCDLQVDTLEPFVIGRGRIHIEDPSEFRSRPSDRLLHRVLTDAGLMAHHPAGRAIAAEEHPRIL